MALCTLYCESSVERDLIHHPLVERMHSPRRFHSRKSPDAPHIGDQLIANIPVPENSDQSEKASSVKSPLYLGF